MVYYFARIIVEYIRLIHFLSIQKVEYDSMVEYKKTKFDTCNTLFSKSGSSSPPGNSLLYSFDTTEIQENWSSDEDKDDNESPFEVFNGNGDCMKCK